MNNKSVGLSKRIEYKVVRQLGHYSSPSLGFRIYIVVDFRKEAARHTYARNIERREKNRMI